MIEIPFNRPYVAGNELSYIAQAVEYGNISGDGFFTQKCAQTLEERLGIAKVLMTTSCTASLEMSAMLCDLGPGDEVIMPSFTFVSTASAVVRCGAQPVFVDIRPDTLNIDEELVAKAITGQTRAIIPVHYAGVACEMDAISELADRNRLRVIEDAAHGVNAFHRGRALGSIGDLGCFSFHETKNYVCGEGGALCLNDPALVERAEIIRDKGTNRQAFSRGEVDRYTWVDLGSSWTPSEIVCAFLLGQLEQLDELGVRRRALFGGYRDLLSPLESEGLLRLPRSAPDCESNAHCFYVLVADVETRDALLAHLRGRGISAVFHFVPLHSSPMARRLGCALEELPVTDAASCCLVRHPFFYELREEQMARVADEVSSFLRQRGARCCGLLADAREAST